MFIGRRYVMVTVDGKTYLFTTKGLSDSTILHYILCELDVTEYTVKFSDKRPHASKNRTWYFGPITAWEVTV